MNLSNIMLAVVSVMLLLLSLFVLTTNTGDCYNDAIALAESSIDTTDDFADFTINSLSGILSGVPHNQHEMDRIASQHHDNTARLEEIQSNC